MIAVSDPSVITSLIHVGRETLLNELHGSVLIPPVACQELSRTHLRIPAFLEVRSVNNLPLVARLTIELDLPRESCFTLRTEFLRPSQRTARPLPTD